jgi:hypothetical protein
MSSQFPSQEIGDLSREFVGIDHVWQRGSRLLLGRQ